jgi:hypothetical protein
VLDPNYNQCFKSVFGLCSSPSQVSFLNQARLSSTTACMVGMIAEAWLSFFRHRRKAGIRQLEIGEARRTYTVLKTKGGAAREVQRSWIRKRIGERR